MYSYENHAMEVIPCWQKVITTSIVSYSGSSILNPEEPALPSVTFRPLCALLQENTAELW